MSSLLTGPAVTNRGRGISQPASRAWPTIILAQAASQPIQLSHPPTLRRVLAGGWTAGQLALSIVFPSSSFITPPATGHHRWSGAGKKQLCFLPSRATKYKSDYPLCFSPVMVLYNARQCRLCPSSEYMYTKFSNNVSTLQRQYTDNLNQIFPEMKLRGPSPILHSCICERFIYSHDRCLPILLQENRWTNHGIIYKLLTDT